MAARPARLSGCSLQAGVLVPQFRITGDAVVGFSVSTRHSAGPGLTTADPYEEVTCQVRDSGVEDGGEGLHASRDIQQGEMVAFYNG